MARFFIRMEDRQGDVLTLRENVHHILHVLRYREARIVKAADDEIRCEIVSRRPSVSEPETQITLFQGMPKRDKMDWIIQKGVEIGMYDFVPLWTRRCVVRYEAQKEEQKIKRWQNIAESAAKQAERGRIPAVHPGLTLAECAKALSRYDLALLFYEKETARSLKTVLSAVPKRPERAAVLIGPEGGWEEDEAELLQGAGAVPVGLGQRILRTETAGMTAAALLLYHFDQM